MSDPFLTEIEAKLRAAFTPEALTLIDESHLHAGHAGARGGARHLRLKLVSAAFAGRTRLARHRAVNDVLRDELRERIHALALELDAPGE